MRLSGGKTRLISVAEVEVEAVEAEGRKSPLPLNCGRGREVRSLLIESHMTRNVHFLRDRIITYIPFLSQRVSIA